MLTHNYYKEMFFKTHLRISLDQLKTRNRETRFIETCLLTNQTFVVDNTNPTKNDRAKYIIRAKEHKFMVEGYYFQSRLADAIERNKQRLGKERIREEGILAAYHKLELPDYSEGFDALYYVEIETKTFKIREWTNEI